MLGFRHDGVFWEYTGRVVLRNGEFYQAVLGEKNLSSPKMMKYVKIEDIYIKEDDIINL